MSRRHAWKLWLLPAVVAFAALVIHAYHARDEVSTPATWPGPPAEALERLADERLDTGQRTLHDRALPVAERLSGYRGALERAETLLVRSAVAQPTRADVLAKLAAVRWELEPHASRRADEFTSLVELSSRLAPHDPVVQERLAALLMRVGQHDEAFRYLREALDLDPGRAKSVVALLAEHGVEPSRVLQQIGPTPELLVAVRSSFVKRGEEGAWLDEVDSAPGAMIDNAMLVTYADSCLRTRNPGRLRDALDRLGTVPDARLESQRLRQRARAWVALGRGDAAAADAAAAADLVPESAVAREVLGDVMTAAGDHDRALRAYRAALERAARRADRPRLRGRLYGKIGRAEEALGRTDPALDAYRLALGHDPDQPIARRRLDALAGAAGADHLVDPGAGRLRASETNH